jgi:hypothetical protein
MTPRMMRTNCAFSLLVLRPIMKSPTGFEYRGNGSNSNSDLQLWACWQQRLELLERLSDPIWRPGSVVRAPFEFGSAIESDANLLPASTHALTLFQTVDDVETWQRQYQKCFALLSFRRRGLIFFRICRNLTPLSGMAPKSFSS